MSGVSGIRDKGKGVRDKEYCSWKPVVDMGNHIYRSDCGAMFDCLGESPSYHKWQWCPVCGKLIDCSLAKAGEK